MNTKYGIQVKVNLAELKRDYKSLPQYTKIVESVIKSSDGHRPFIVAEQEDVFYISGDIDARKLGENVAKIDPKYLIFEKEQTVDELLNEYETSFVNNLDLMAMKRRMLSEVGIGAQDEDILDITIFKDDEERIPQNEKEPTKEKSKKVEFDVTFGFYICINLSDCNCESDEKIMAFCQDEISGAIGNCDIYEYVKDISVDELTTIDYCDDDGIPEYIRLLCGFNCVVCLPEYYFTHDDNYMKEFKEILSKSIESAFSEKDHNSFIDKAEINEIDITDARFIEDEPEKNVIDKEREENELIFVN
jgi:hypothetical protein